MTISEQNLYIEKIIGGTTMTHAKEICNSKGMELFEPRDATTNHVVWEKARGYFRWSSGYWLNVRRVNPQTMYVGISVQGDSGGRSPWLG